MRFARATIRGDRSGYEKATAALRATFQAVAAFVLQVALTALLGPVANALMKGVALATRVGKLVHWAKDAAVGVASTIGANATVYGPDYSAEMLKRDLLTGFGGSIGQGATLKLLAPVSKGMSDRLGQKVSKEIIEMAGTVGSMEGAALAEGKSLGSDLSVQNFVEEHLLGKVSDVATTTITKGLEARAGTGDLSIPTQHRTSSDVLAVKNRTSGRPAELRQRSGPLPGPRATNPRRTSATSLPGRSQFRWPSRRPPRSPTATATKAPAGGAGLDASVERSSQLDTITDQQAANEVAYIDKHPELPVEGTPPNQYVKLGEHKIAEVPGGGCERHSAGARKIDCPIRFLEGVAQKPDLTEADIQGLADHLGISPDEVKARFARAARESTVQERAAMSEGRGIDVGGEGMNVTSPMVRRPPSPRVPRAPAEVPLSTIAEQQLRAPPWKGNSPVERGRSIRSSKPRSLRA